MDGQAAGNIPWKLLWSLDSRGRRVYLYLSSMAGEELNIYLHSVFGCRAFVARSGASWPGPPALHQTSPATAAEPGGRFLTENMSGVAESVALAVTRRGRASWLARFRMRLAICR